ncbi:hypothetical protein EDB83DRAFT_2613332 [Lactarius deliciosus]|nr:hypothetical protein EDB83DRAFT_2613332 [Lactarius deliciosus]
MLFYKPLVSLVTAIALTGTVTASATPMRRTDNLQCNSQTQYLYCCKTGIVGLVGLGCVLDPIWYFLGFHIKLLFKLRRVSRKEPEEQSAWEIVDFDVSLGPNIDISFATARSTATARRMKAVRESWTKSHFEGPQGLITWPVDPCRIIKLESRVTTFKSTTAPQGAIVQFASAHAKACGKACGVMM